jgi:hypothetical protein
VFSDNELELEGRKRERQNDGRVGDGRGLWVIVGAFSFDVVGFVVFVVSHWSRFGIRSILLVLMWLMNAQILITWYGAVSYLLNK